MNRQDLFLQARRQVERRRQRAETQAIQRREEIYAALPMLADLDKQMTEAGVSAARAATEGFAIREADYLNALKGIQLRRSVLLQQCGLTTADLEPHYTCTLCNDTGKVNGLVCSCILEEEKRLRREEIHKNGPLRLNRFEDFSLDYYSNEPDATGNTQRSTMEGALHYCQDYAADFGLRSGNILLFGDAGLGKTHLALSIVNEVLDKGYDVLYVSAQRVFASLSRDRYGSDDLFSSMLHADLLVLDDLGTEYVDAYTLSRLYELVEGRLRRRPTIYTTNILTQDGFYQRYTEKIASRLLGECQLLRFVGKDIRLQLLQK